jgi:hypothetical protein
VPLYECVLRIILDNCNQLSELDFQLAVYHY